MRAVMAFASRAGSTAAAARGAASTGAGMGNMSKGLSALGSIMEYAGQRQQAASLDQDARDERMAGRQEFIQASERVNQIDAEYNRLIGDQLVTSAGMGIDAGSGGVQVAREATQAEADREKRIIRNNAETQARLRFARSINLREAAKTQRFASTLKLVTSLGAAAMGAA